MQTLNPYLAPIIDAIDQFFNECSLSNEHQLIKYLQDKKVVPFEHFSLALTKDLFSAHFLCMHALYHLKNQYETSQNYTLTIQSVRIERIAFSGINVMGDSQHVLKKTDPLAVYYLNAAHYFETEEEEINDLMSSFWKKYIVQDNKKDALKTLNLPENADAKMIKARYLQLAQQHHPDKGGCAENFSEICQAKTILDNLS